MNSANPVDALLRLSEILTGEPRSDRVLATEYARVLSGAAGEPAVAALIEHFEALVGAGHEPSAIAELLFADGVVGNVAKQLTVLWFVGGVMNSTTKAWEFATAEHYFRGLAWSVIGGHPPGLSGGYSGHWRYPAA